MANRRKQARAEAWTAAARLGLAVGRGVEGQISLDGIFEKSEGEVRQLRISVECSNPLMIAFRRNGDAVDDANVSMANRDLTKLLFDEVVLTASEAFEVDATGGVSFCMDYNHQRRDAPWVALWLDRCVRAATLVEAQAKS